MYLTEAVPNLGRAATLTLALPAPGLAVQAHPPSFTLEHGWESGAAVMVA
jgi:hypothetical protein